jgi:hypothetical protein
VNIDPRPAGPAHWKPFDGLSIAFLSGRIEFSINLPSTIRDKSWSNYFVCSPSNSRIPPIQKVSEYHANGFRCNSVSSIVWPFESIWSSRSSRSSCETRLIKGWKSIVALIKIKKRHVHDSVHVMGGDTIMQETNNQQLKVCSMLYLMHHCIIVSLHHEARFVR